jgi:steroid 5-alpha reductase family enzyme
MMFELLLLNAAILIVLVLIQWAISVKINDVSFIDAFWGAGMGILAVASWLHVGGGPGDLATLIMLMTAAWGFRLGIYLFLRWRKEGEDKRYKMILKKDREAGRFAQAALTRVWLMQAVLLFMVSSPAQVGILASGAPAPIPPLAWLGFGLWCVGVFFEWVGDWQLTRFRANPANHGQVLDTGLWRYTRHPNYFGDFCAWWGIWIACAAAGWGYAAATVIGPLFLSFTLTKWSGVTLLEKGLDKTKGDKYADYKRRTSAFFPMLPGD